MIDDATFTQVVRRPKRTLFMGLCWEAWLRPPNLIVSHSVQADTEAKQRSEKAGMKREWDETWWIEACPRDADGETFPLTRLCFFITPSSQNDNRSQQRQHLSPFYSSSALKLTVWYAALCADVGSVRAGKSDMSLIGMLKKVVKQNMEMIWSL